MSGDQVTPETSLDFFSRYVSKLQLLSLIPLICMFVCWWDSSCYESIGYWDQSTISTATGQGYGSVRIEWMTYNSPTRPNEPFITRYKVDESYSPGLRVLGLQFPPAIEHTHATTPQDDSNITFIAWWLIALLYIVLWLAGFYWLRRRSMRSKRVMVASTVTTPFQSDTAIDR